MTGVVHFLGALALLLSVALLYEQRTGVSLLICALQGVLAALVAGLQAWSLAAPQMGLTVVLAAALNGVAMPIALHHLGDRPGMKRGTRRNPAIRVSVAAAVLIMISVAAVRRAWTDASAPILALGLSMLLLGLLLLAVGRHRNGPALGLLSGQNGLVLAASVVPGLPPLMVLACTIPLVPGLVAAAMWLPRAYQPLATPR